MSSKISKETKDQINKIYLELLNRESDENGLSYYGNKLENQQKKAIEELYSEIKNSAEYKMKNTALLKNDKAWKKPENLEGKSPETIVNDFYQELLLRPADAKGLAFYSMMLKTKIKTVEEIRNLIFNSEEATSIRNFTHYTDKYWNDLERVRRYKNKLSTDDENTNWIESIPKRFGELLPFKKVLVVGCGNGWVERKLCDLGIGEEFDAFDISDSYLDEAKQKKGDRPINYFKEDINTMKSIKNNEYDAVFNYAILHHVYEIDFAIKKLAQVLKPNGLMFNEEYVGAARNQYPDKQVKLMEKVMSALPKKFHSKYPLRLPIEMFRVDPTEAVHSDLIRSTYSKYFDLIIDRDMNGGIAYQILWNNTERFLDDSDQEAKKWLEYILEKDYEYSKNGQVPNLFWYGVGKPKNLKS
ncbi:MAG: class I SAM-dependent methyltransferase [Nitrosotalea sp.]